MKKKIRKLELNRETVRRLDNVRGAIPCFDDTVTDACSHELPSNPHGNSECCWTYDGGMACHSLGCSLGRFNCA